MELKDLAPQLKSPEGHMGLTVGEMMNEANARITHHAYELLSIQDNECVLEIGFGNGKFLPDLLQLANNVRYAGIDISATMVEDAMRRNQKYVEEQKAVLKQASVSSIPFPDNFFHKICAINSLYFWENPKEDMREVCRVLKPGGKLVIAGRPLSDLNKTIFEKNGFTFYPTKVVCSFLENTQLTFVESRIENDPPSGFFEKLNERNSQYIIAVKEK